MGIAAFFAAFLFSNLLWRMNQKKFSRIIQREMAAGKAQSFNQ
jgi:hypothetical protein